MICFYYICLTEAGVSNKPCLWQSALGMGQCIYLTITERMTAFCYRGICRGHWGGINFFLLLTLFLMTYTEVDNEKGHQACVESTLMKSITISFTISITSERCCSYISSAVHHKGTRGCWWLEDRGSSFSAMLSLVGFSSSEQDSPFSATSACDAQIGGDKVEDENSSVTSFSVQRLSCPFSADSDRLCYNADLTGVHP